MFMLFVCFSNSSQMKSICKLMLNMEKELSYNNISLIYTSIMTKTTFVLTLKVLVAVVL